MIGRGAVVAAGSVVTKNVERSSIVAGNSAKSISVGSLMMNASGLRFSIGE